MIKKNTYHVSFFPLSKLQKLQAILILFFGRSIYAHALDWFRPFANQSKGINKFCHLSWDVHGVVPEEMALLKDPRVEEFEVLEKIIAHTAHDVVCVTKKLKEHLQDKYPTINPNWQIVPMRVNLPKISPRVLKNKKKLAKNELPTVIYAGGLQPWQLVEEMQAFVVKHLEKASWIFCVPDTTAFWQTFPLKHKPPNVKVLTANKQQLHDFYLKAHYGLIFRDDNIINRVSCPSKLTEYLAYGITPIVKSPHLGDFMEDERYRTVSQHTIRDLGN